MADLIYTQEQLDSRIAEAINKRFKTNDERTKKLEDEIDTLKTQLSEAKNSLADYETVKKQNEEFSTKLKEFEHKESVKSWEAEYLSMNGKKDAFDDFQKLIDKDKLTDDKSRKAEFKSVMEKYPNIFVENKEEGTKAQATTDVGATPPENSFEQILKYAGR